MKKRTKKLAIILSIIMISLTGCKEKETDITTESEVVEETNLEESKEVSADDNKEENTEEGNNTITLGEYKHVIDVNKEDFEITDEYIENEISFYTDLYCEATDKRTEGIVSLGEKINVNYTFKYNGYDLNNVSDITLGNDEIIPGLDEQLVEKEVGSIITFDTNFPEDYFDSNMAGEPVSVVVTINYVLASEPTLTNEKIAEITNNECNSIDEFKSYLKDAAIKNAEISYYDIVLDKVVENCSIKCDYTDITTLEYTKLLEEYDNYCQTFGMSAEDTAAMYGYDSVDAYKDYLKTIADTNAKRTLVIKELAKELNISVSEEEYSDYKNELLQFYTQEEIDSMFSEDSIKFNTLKEKVLSKLIELQL